MPLSMLNLDDTNEFIDFNRIIYPKRNGIRKRFEWYMLGNPFLEDRRHPYVLLYNKDSKIVGQSLLNPFVWRYMGKEHLDYMGIDWYVLPEYRGPIGTALAMKTLKDRPHYFGIGFSEAAKNIWSALGVRDIGRVDIYIWLGKPMRMIRSVARMMKGSRREIGPLLPKRIDAGNDSFHIVESPDHWKEHEWKGVIEFSRPAKYLRWRFFDSPRKYFFYMSSDRRSYFVIRESFMKGLNFIVLVDYRVPEMDRKSFDSILRACKKIARTAKYDGILAGSSHSFFDNRFKRNFFFRTRRGGGAIMTNADVGEVPEKIISRELVYATIADSDMDLVQF